ncbi:MAG TPA: glycosyltransferase family 9 protein [Terrimicrobiaceae bacterium]
MSGRILVIRGGALGDFILTLPAIRLLRENFATCALDILGYRHIAALAEGRYYAHATRSIESGALAGFFNPKGSLDSALCEYFAGFEQIVSYLYDPDGLFEGGLRRAGVRSFLSASPKISEGEHAARQLARPLEQLALQLEDPAARIFPSEKDFLEARTILSLLSEPLVAIHPGSGSERKNWPLENWQEVQKRLLAHPRVGHLLVVGGESDRTQLSRMKLTEPAPCQTILESLPLPILGAVLSQCALFIGHDSGISHLAAAAGAPCLLLFGPTDPKVWAPTNESVVVLQGESGNLSNLNSDAVLAKIDEMLVNASRNNHRR